MFVRLFHPSAEVIEVQITVESLDFAQIKPPSFGDFSGPLNMRNGLRLHKEDEIATCRQLLVITIFNARNDSSLLKEFP